MSKEKSLGQVAYEAYCDDRAWKSYDGRALPKWEAVTKPIQRGWQMAARAVAQNIFDNEPPF